MRARAQNEQCVRITRTRHKGLIKRLSLFRIFWERTFWNSATRRIRAICARAFSRYRQGPLAAGVEPGCAWTRSAGHRQSRDGPGGAQGTARGASQGLPCSRARDGVEGRGGGRTPERSPRERTVGTGPNRRAWRKWQAILD